MTLTVGGVVTHVVDPPVLVPWSKNWHLLPDRQLTHAELGWSISSGSIASAIASDDHPLRALIAFLAVTGLTALAFLLRKP